MFTINKGIVKEAKYRETPNKAGKNKPELIVVHDTASSLNTDGVVDWLCNPKAKASAHFVVGVNGELWQLGSIDEVLWHTGKSSYKGRSSGNSCNSFSVGIEIVNPGWLVDGKDGFAYHSTAKSLKWKYEDVVKMDSPNHTEKGRYWLPYTEAQLKTVFNLCKAICEKEDYTITDIVPHWLISPGRKQDTNPLFPLEELKAFCFPDTLNEPSPEDLLDIDNHSNESLTVKTKVALNVRELPDWKAGILGVLSVNNRIPTVGSVITNNKAVWYKIIYNGKEGYISAEHVIVGG